MKTKKGPRITHKKPAGKDHQVVTVTGGNGGYCKSPCPECPWVCENAGSFPAEAFRISANTAEDMATHMFSCHMRGVINPGTCAGFLLRGADDNMSVRIKRMQGKMLDVVEDTRELHESYREMAIANGVDPDDPAIRNCMPEARGR